MKKQVRIRIAAAIAAALLFAWAQPGSAAVVAWGSRGSQVSLVQQKLKQYGYYDGAVDGIFARDTYNAVIWFQEKNGLRADGVVGSATAAALGVTLKGSSLASAHYQESELTGLAGVTTTFRVEPGKVLLNRTGRLSSQMVFQQGVSHDSLYQMAFGALMLTVKATFVYFDIVPDGGVIDLSYNIDIENTEAGVIDYHLDIRAK